jgi:hypothetical protein
MNYVDILQKEKSSLKEVPADQSSQLSYIQEEPPSKFDMVELSPVSKW